ncbi:uncharacterized protein BDR25DRAFT_362430 [Lindgomyces ingoldianus]|uniref:Uncharacterized protein n=1 Tax=Lindgomyces ingoldianus TaxID=673940 RepID=A0ACB6QAF0_9PLEO|nr:uncharacterized protein BDR25DRAFT_362430 [Lindgomyces ingoldianus]KAF2463860.1 hypothetical protein BDR25DRAFT_362430 [Lindgomyces ingoldianus]
MATDRWLSVTLTSLFRLARRLSEQRTTGIRQTEPLESVPHPGFFCKNVQMWWCFAATLTARHRARALPHQLPAPRPQTTT